MRRAVVVVVTVAVVAFAVGFGIRLLTGGDEPEAPVPSGTEATLLDNQEIRPRPVDAAGLAAIVAGEADASWVYALPDRIPMDVRVEDGLVVRADERYVP